MAELAEHLIVDAAELAACCEHLAACKRFGLDTEFVGEENYHPKLCLVQVATDDRLFLIDPLAIESLDVFWKMVVDPANLVIVHAGREEVRLCHLWSGQTPGNLFDMQIAAGLVGLGYPLGHGPLVHHVLGIRLSKGETLTEWRNRPLTRSQIRYAFDDVRYLLPVWEKLEARLSALGRTEWAREEFSRLRALATPEAPAAENEKWRKLRGTGSLDRRRLAIVRELFLWRDQTAAHANRPPRTIVRDDLIVEIARRNPAKARDLHVVRGLAKRYAEPMLQAIEHARGLPLEACPVLTDREQDPSQVSLVASVLTAALADFAARNHLAANLVASNQDVKLLVRSRFQGKPFPPDNLLATGWRAVHVLPELERILSGRRSLRVADLRAEAPFAYQDHPGATDDGSRLN
jgi:ribonuclease D